MSLCQMSKPDNWENENPIDLRTKIALKVLFLIFRVLSPYRFSHDFEKEITSIQKEIEGLK